MAKRSASGKSRRLSIETSPIPIRKAHAVAPDPTTLRSRLTPDSVLLFRYSALTFNAHRIHYDQPYATEAEAYPGLVVHGPLQATLLLNLAADALNKALNGFLSGASLR